MQGWITVFSWIITGASAVQVYAYVIQGLIAFGTNTYEPKAWHMTLLMWACILGCLICNLFLRKILNVMETITGFCHILFFIISIIILLTLAERSSSEFVFQTLTRDVSGWSNPGVAWSIGLLVPVLPLTGSDGVIHMSTYPTTWEWSDTDESLVDETKQPRKRVPRAMVFSCCMNALMQLIYSIVLLFCVGDYKAVSTSRFPIMDIYFAATGSKKWTMVIVLVLHLAVITISTLNCFASISRLVWAFARDKGLPFHNIFTYVSLLFIFPYMSLARNHKSLEFPSTAIGTGSRLSVYCHVTKSQESRLSVHCHRNRRLGILTRRSPPGLASIGECRTAPRPTPFLEVLPSPFTHYRSRQSTTEQFTYWLFSLP